VSPCSGHGESACSSSNILSAFRVLLPCTALYGRILFVMEYLFYGGVRVVSYVDDYRALQFELPTTESHFECMLCCLHYDWNVKPILQIL
jgi:hypothetical protein